MLAEQRLVGRDDRFAALECGQNHGFGETRATDQFGHDLHLWVIDDLRPVGGHPFAGNGVGTRFVEGLHRDLAHVYLNTDTGGEERAVALEGVKHPAAYRASADHAEIKLLHSCGG